MSKSDCKSPKSASPVNEDAVCMNVRTPVLLAVISEEKRIGSLYVLGCPPAPLPLPRRVAAMTRLLTIILVGGETTALLVGFFESFPSPPTTTGGVFSWTEGAGAAVAAAATLEVSLAERNHDISVRDDYWK
jgi:hypothetical protein